MRAPACPLNSWGSVCRRAGWSHSQATPPRLRHSLQAHTPQAAARLAEAVALALGCEPWPALLPLCQEMGALRALAWLRSQTP